ncbi:hypothetical protein HDV00_003054 [Rhizophlyctis rosea]|nr:hypothetical protein HDV00_003054 [Rhizophlyctis rosea]
MEQDEPEFLAHQMELNRVDQAMIDLSSDMLASRVMGLPDAARVLGLTYELLQALEANTLAPKRACAKEDATVKETTGGELTDAFIEDLSNGIDVPTKGNENHPPEEFAPLNVQTSTVPFPQLSDVEQSSEQAMQMQCDAGCGKVDLAVSLPDQWFEVREEVDTD